MKLTTVSVNLRASRRVDIKNKVHYYLERNWKYSGLEELICDEIDVWGINDLKSCLEDEKWMFERERNLPQDVLFDSHRYFWKFEKNNDGTINLIEKWYPPVADSAEDCSKSNFDNEVDNNAVLS